MVGGRIEGGLYGVVVGLWERVVYEKEKVYYGVCFRREGEGDGGGVYYYGNRVEVGDGGKEEAGK